VYAYIIYEPYGLLFCTIVDAVWNLASRYGFYGEVIRESENYRWMGPARYDFSGTMVFLKHRWLIGASGPFLVFNCFFQLDQE
jgi:hypothetical protein